MRVLALAALLGACVVDTGVFAGKTCETLLDCPLPYTCAEVRAAGVRTCELLRPVDASTPVGTPVFYCAGPAGGPDVHTVVSNFCLANCHGGAGMEYPNAPKNFRLDFYASQEVDGVMFLGAFKEADDMKLELDIGAMPPPDANLALLSAADARVISQWVASGKNLAPAGVVVGNDCDAGGEAIVPDAGSPDAGATDGG